MELVHDPVSMRRACDDARARGSRVGLVPTMGALHGGHLRLVDHARDLADRAREVAGFVVVTVFVNPTQFGPNEDFSRYPRTLDADAEGARSRGADLVFAPEAAAMYPAGEETRVRPGRTAEPLCGAFRPGHFEGVCTIVAKLFALAGPCVAVFGRKDYQQLQVIRRMTADLMLPVDIVGVPTIREPDGLALSSRNRYLAADERDRALSLARGLSRAARAFAAGERSRDAVLALARGEVDAAATSVDYVDVADPESLVPFGPGAKLPERAVLAIAARVGKTRLIDNVVLGEDAPPMREVATDA